MAVKGRSGSQMKLDWFFIDMFISFANDKHNPNKVRSQKHVEVFNYNDEPYTITFERGDKLNKCRHDYRLDGRTYCRCIKCGKNKYK